MRSVFYPQLINGRFGDPALYVRIAHRGKALLFDCGELHGLTTRELLKIDAVFISHAHIDHLVGFDHLLRTFLYQDKTLLICGPAGLIDKISARLRSYTWNLIEGYPLVVRVREWRDGLCRQATFRACRAFSEEDVATWTSPDGVLYATPDLTVQAIPLAHGDIVSMAFALEETMHVAIHKDALDARHFAAGPWLTCFKDLVRRGAHDAEIMSVPLSGGDSKKLSLGELRETIAHCESGMKVVYVTDVAPCKDNCERIVRLAQNAHLLVIEAMFAAADYERARQRHHLTARLAGEIARNAKVARLLVFHHSPRYEQTPDLLNDEAQKAFRGE